VTPTFLLWVVKEGVCEKIAEAREQIAQFMTQLDFEAVSCVVLCVYVEAGWWWAWEGREVGELGMVN
jgi:hypothetical protein